MTLFTDSGLWNVFPSSRSGRGLEEAGAREEEEDNQLIILPTLRVLTRLRQQNRFMAPHWLGSLLPPRGLVEVL